MSCFYLPLLDSHIPIEPSALPHVHTRIYQKRKSIGLEEKLRLQSRILHSTISPVLGYYVGQPRIMCSKKRKVPCRNPRPASHVPHLFAPYTPERWPISEVYID